MDGFPLDEDLGFPISPVSSALDALCHLQPRSSIPTSQLGFTWSSGDIPIILYDDGYVQDPDNIGHTKRGSSVTLDKDVGYAWSSNRLSTATGSVDRIGTPASVLTASASSDTIRSGATFGPRRQTSTLVNESTSQFECQSSSAPETPSFDAIEYGEEAKINSDHSQETSLGNSEVFQRRNSKGVDLSDWYFAPSTSGIVAPESTFEGSTLDLSSLLQNKSDFTLEDTPSEKTPRALSWISTREWNYEQYKDFVSQEGSPHLPARPGTFRKQNGSENPCTSSARRKALERRGSNVESLVPSSSVSDLNGFQEEFHPQDKRMSRLLCPPYQGADASWLKDTTIQLLIDQEGFRDAEPSFRFSSILRVRSSTDPKSSESIMAQFRPTSRQFFHFHHAPFESPPVLRRITVNNDEASDYISRQAHLILKSNGVYVVHGQETVAAEHDSESVKLCWQFEYLVDDRRLEASGSKRNLEGEKIFTPLTFSCSPKLLSPTQAKRINIMQVFKKIVAPKLVAEKLQPPSSGRGINNSLAGRNGSLELDGGPVHLDTRLHRQHDPDETGHDPTTLSPQSITSCQPQSRHIVPPARLSDLLTSPLKENFPMPITPDRKRPSISATETPDRISEALAALSPRPKQLPRKYGR